MIKNKYKVEIYCNNTKIGQKPIDYKYSYADVKI